MAKRLLILQHTAWEVPGAFLLKILARYAIRYELIDLWRQALPPIAGYDGLIVLGGSPNIDQEDCYPFLKMEKQFIRNALKQDMPYLGFCLGMQLLADALGAKVGNNFQASVGFVQGHLTHEGRAHPFFLGMPESFPLFKWHRQAVIPPLPKSLQILATSADCEIESLGVANRAHIIGVQFDNHLAAPNDVALFLDNDQAWLAQTKRHLDAAAVISVANRYAGTTKKQFRRLLKNFLALI